MYSETKSSASASSSSTSPNRPLLTKRGKRAVRPKALGLVNNAAGRGLRANNCLGKFKSGQRALSTSGYVRLYDGEHRGRYEHRVVMARMCAEWCVYEVDPKTGLPPGFHVEHVDHCRTHNCAENLLLLQATIHNHCSAAHARVKRLAEKAGGLGDMSREEIAAMVLNRALYEAEVAARATRGDPVPF